MTEPLTSNYPAALDDDGQLGGDQVNIKSFTLGSSISDVDPVITADAAISGVNVPFYLLAESELIYVESISGSDFDVVVRGAGGTTATAHTAGIPLYVVYAANWFNQLKRAIIAVQTELGVSPSGSYDTLVDRLDADVIRPNVLINGDFDIWQRGTSFASAATNTKVADRFKYQKAGTAVHDITRDTDVPSIAQSGHKSSYSMKLDVTTADTSIAAGDFSGFQYPMEGYDYAPLKDQDVTLSFWVKATKTGTYCVAFRNGGPDRSYVVEYTVDASDTWEKKEITVTLDQSGGTENYDNALGMSIFWTLSCGSNFQTTANAWQTGSFVSTANQVNATDSASNNFFLSQVKLEKSSVATPFIKRPFIHELLLCQRYFYKTFQYDTTPAQAQGVQHGIRWPAPVAGVATHRPQSFFFPVPLRTTPTITFYSPVSASPEAYNAQAVADLTGITLGVSGPILIDINATGTAATAVGHSIIVCFTAEADF